jgi:xanthine/CO dehydrogenase XdhC/CoxF family maturation factor
MSEQRVLSSEFRSEDGRSCRAIGGGHTVTAAIDYAREACPEDTEWDVVGWEDLYGD